MMQKGIIDRLEENIWIIETDSGMIEIKKEDSPIDTQEGQIVTFDDNKIISIDYEETKRLEDLVKERFRKILDK